MKKAIAILFCAIMALSLAACSTDKDNKESFKEYVEKRNDILSKEQQLFTQTREAIPGIVKGENEKKQKQIVSDYKKLVKEAKSITATDDLKESNTEFGKAIQANSEAVTLKMQAAQKKDTLLELKSQKKLREGKRLGQSSEKKLKEIAKKYHFALK